MQCEYKLPVASIWDASLASFNARRCSLMHVAFTPTRGEGKRRKGKEEGYHIANRSNIVACLQALIMLIIVPRDISYHFISLQFRRNTHSNQMRRPC